MVKYFGSPLNNKILHCNTVNKTIHIAVDDFRSRMSHENGQRRIYNVMISFIESSNIKKKIKQHIIWKWQNCEEDLWKYDQIGDSDPPRETLH